MTTMTTEPEITLDLGEGLAGETIEGLEDFAEEPTGAFPKGWYKAEVIEGFQTKKGKTVTTGDSISSKGDSRNLKLAIKVTGPNNVERNMIASFNYRTSDFTAERMAFIKELREENKGVQGKWSDSDGQRSSLALANIGGLTKAVGFAPKLGNGGVIAGAYVGQKLDVYLGIDQKGFNEVKNFAKPGTKTA